MLSPPLLVGIVLSREFSGDLARLADQMPVWIADSASNREAAERYRQVQQSEYPWGVTTFQTSPTENPLDWALQIVPVVMEHHGLYSQDPPVQTLEFVGVQANQELLGILAEYGFTRVEPSSAGFRITAA
jgi:hypothetical protein